MIRHLVMWRFKTRAEGRTAAANRERVRQALRALPAQIPGIVEFRVASIDDADPEACQLCLDSLFESHEALQAYAVHPAHQAVVALLRKVRSEKRFADFELEGPDTVTTGNRQAN